jgi:hypothetical protein
MVNSKSEDEEEEKEWDGDGGRVWDLVTLCVLLPIVDATLSVDLRLRDGIESKFGRDQMGVSYKWF